VPTSPLPEWSHAFGIDDRPPLALVTRGSNEMWRGIRQGATVYLRVTPDRHRERQEVQAELAWMSALADAGMRVVRPLAAQGGALLVDSALDGRPAWVACFTAAPGRPARKPDDYVDAVLDSWAGLLADLHGHARAQPAGAGEGRRPWHGDRVFLTARQARDASVAPAQQMLGQLEAWLRSLPAEPDVFGLTHADLHLGNLNVAGGSVTAFDFDDACLHFYLHDLAVAVTSIRKAGWEHPGRFDAAAAEARFVDQYVRRGVLDRRWLGRLEPFVAYRMALSACWGSRAGEIGELDQALEGWFERSLPWWLEQLRLREAEIRAGMAAGG
jgi:Ser/Thr protein kinase RdoA (MazF antagonist)